MSAMGLGRIRMSIRGADCWQFINIVTKLAEGDAPLAPLSQPYGGIGRDISSRET